VKTIETVIVETVVVVVVVAVAVVAMVLRHHAVTPLDGMIEQIIEFSFVGFPRQTESGEDVAALRETGIRPSVTTNLITFWSDGLEE
jgi:hypothetical protein